MEEQQEFPCWKQWHSFNSTIVKFVSETQGYKYDKETSLLSELSEYEKWISCYDKRWVAIEPQFVLADYYDKEITQMYRDNSVFKSIEKNDRGDGGSTSYYSLPEGATELYDLIYHKEMNHSIGEAFCAIYRLKDNGEYVRNIKKAIFYLELELKQCDM